MKELIKLKYCNSKKGGGWIMDEGWVFNSK